MSSKNGFGLLGLLITLALIAILSGIIMKAYFGNNTPAQEVRQGIDAIDAARAAKGMIDQKSEDYNRELNK